jgi:hypothetical protein
MESRRPPEGARASPPREERKEGKLASRIREAYRRERSQFETRRSGRAIEWQVASRYDGLPARGPESRAVPSVWPKLASDFIRLNLPAAEYIHFCFERAPFGHAPEPFQLLSGSNVAEFRDYQSRVAPGIVEQQLNSDRQLFEQSVVLRQTDYHMTLEEACRSTITDLFLEVSPLFRFCFCHRSKDPGLRRLARLWLSLARRQFWPRATYYVMFWHEWLPDSWRMAVS